MHSLVFYDQIIEVSCISQPPLTLHPEPTAPPLWTQSQAQTNSKDHLTSFLLLGCVLLQVGCEPRLSQGLQDCSHPPHMLCPGFTVNDDIIQIGGSICNMWTKHLVHEALKVAWVPNKLNGNMTNCVEKAVFSLLLWKSEQCLTSAGVCQPEALGWHQTSCGSRCKTYGTTQHIVWLFYCYHF